MAAAGKVFSSVPPNIVMGLERIVLWIWRVTFGPAPSGQSDGLTLFVPVSVDVDGECRP